MQVYAQIAGPFWMEATASQLTGYLR
jgi:hypothetical protein